MNPKHENPTGENRIAWAPYNFVPLNEQVLSIETDDGRMDQSRFSGNSGFIDCTLTTRSPLYIRTGMSPDFFGNYSDNHTDMMRDKKAREENAAFFHGADGLPMIPGSSLRGMLRSLVEIISFGKMNWVSKDPLIFRDVGGRTSLGRDYRNRLMETYGPMMIPQMKAGYIEKEDGDYFIRPARKMNNGDPFYRIDAINGLSPSYQNRPWNNTRNAWQISVTPVKYPSIGVKVSIATQGGTEQGVLVKSGRMQKKRYEAVIGLPDPSAQRIPISSELVTAYKEQLSQEVIKLLGSSDGVLRHDHPVFYLMENGKLTFFAHNMMMRLPYQHNPLDFVPEQLRRAEDLDMAEAMFGRVADEKAESSKSLAGRISVEDATLHQDQDRKDLYLSPNPVTLRILGSPKPTTFQHYLVQTNENREQLRHYNDMGQTVIRGRKLYWHQQNITMQDITENGDQVNWESDKQHTQVRPVKAGTRFSFRVHFDNLSDVELGCLLWAINLPGSPQKEYCHKLGMGKPYGMGSVQLSSDLFLIDRSKRYSALFSDNGWNLGEEKQETPQRYIQTFEKFVFDHLSDDKSTANNFGELENIRMLLAMLSWPGPDRKNTRYMLIKNGDGKNEYKDRPVLPDPLGVMGETRPKPAQPAASQPVRSVQNTGSRPISQPRISAPEVPVKELVRLEVSDISEGDIYLDPAEKFPVEIAYAVIDRKHAAGFKFKIGSVVRCEVIRKETTPDDEVVWHVRPVSVIK